MSLDGFVADKNGSLDFFTQLTPDQNKYSDQDQLRFLERVDTILLGRKTYEGFVEFWPNVTTKEEVIADKLNETKKIVFSNTLTNAPWGNYADAAIISGNAVAAVRQLKAMPGKDMVLWGSISLAQALMKEDLVDEYHIQLCSVLTGGGRRLFTEDSLTANLQITEVRKYDAGTVFLGYKR